jgi:hypothetical protein
MTVDEMRVNEMTVDEMTVDDMPVDKMTWHFLLESSGRMICNIQHLLARLICIVWKKGTTPKNILPKTISPTDILPTGCLINPAMTLSFGPML